MFDRYRQESLVCLLRVQEREFQQGKTRMCPQIISLPG